MKKIKVFVCVAITVALAVSMFVGCNKKIAAQEFYYDDGIVADGANYDTAQFFRNDLEVDFFADPGAIYITEGEDAGWFFAYGTTGNGGGFAIYRTKDFSSWEPVGFADVKPKGGWVSYDAWAPEVIYRNGKYWMYYSASAADKAQYAGHYLGVAVADSPRGPFELYESETPNAHGETITKSRPPIVFQDHFEEMRATGWDIPLSANSFSSIDASPFVDGNGDLYLYFTVHSANNPLTTVHMLCGMKMFDPVTPDYSTVTPLVASKYDTIEKVDGKWTGIGNTGIDVIDEGPFVTRHTTLRSDGTTATRYYLTYSDGDNGYKNPFYRVFTATSNMPLGRFEKDHAPPTHGIASGFTHMSGTAHHSFVQAGDEMFIFYHAHVKRNLGTTNPRALAVDRMAWAYDATLGYDKLYSNGPTYSLCPLPNVTTGRENLATHAVIRATNAESGRSTDLLRDGVVPIHDHSDGLEFRVNGGTKIEITLKKESKVSALFIYNSYLYENAFAKIDKITLRGDGKTYVIRDLGFNPAYYDTEEEYIRPGAAATAAFDEALQVREITIEIGTKIAGGGSIGIGDIAVMGVQ